MHRFLEKTKAFFLESDTSFLFALSLIALGVIYWIIVLATHGLAMESYFSRDYHDLFMDYFNILPRVVNGDPYSFKSNYPPLILLIFSFLYRLIPGDYVIIDSYSLREYTPAGIGFLFFILVCILGAFLCILAFSPKGHKGKYLFATAFVFSGPFLFALERGNFIILALVFLLSFLLLYDSEKLPLRIVAYFCLAVSAALKIYPAVFGLLVLLKKRFWEAGLLAVLGVLVFFLPFFAFHGLGDFVRMMDYIRELGEYQALTNLGSAHGFSFLNLFSIAAELSGGTIVITPLVAGIVAAVFTLPLFFLAETDYQRTLSWVMLCIWVPTFSYTYTLIFFVVPLLYLLKEEPKLNWTNVLPFICLLLILTPMALPAVFNYSRYRPGAIDHGTLLINCSIIVMLASAYGQAISQRISKRKEHEIAA